MIEGVDALGNPDPAALVAAGKVFVGRYLKNLTRSQVDAYHAAGVAVVLIGETTGKRSLSGSVAGAADAAAARIQATKLGAPDSAAIYLAEVDFDATDAQMPVITAYYHGAQSILGPRTGGYGGFRAAKALADAGIPYVWQTYAWSGGRWEPRAQIQQYLNGQNLGGTAVDYDRATVADYGAWEADVALTQADIDAVANATALKVLGYRNAGSTAPPAPYPNTENLDLYGLVRKAAATVAGPGVPVDPAALAKAVADELAARLKA